MHTPLSRRFLRRLLARAAALNAGSVDAASARMSRRGFLAGIAAGGLAAGISACPSPVRRAFGSGAAAPRVAILGAGLAGLVACDRLRKAGLFAEVYEARSRVGGRVISDRRLDGAEAGRRALELGAEFIDTDHTLMRGLAAELGLELFDSQAVPQLERTYWFHGRRHDEADILADFMPIAQAIMKARAEMDEDIEDVGWEAPSPGAVTYDRMSLAEFCERAGASPLATTVIESAYGAEFGLEIAHQSSLNMIAMLGDEDLVTAAGEGAWDVYGSSDERFKVIGGNDRVAAGLAERNPGRVHLGKALLALRERSDGAFALAFDDGTEVVADLVVCTLPFSVLRGLELNIPVRPLKRRAIDELGYGTNSKLIVPFAHPVWEEAGDDGSVFGEGEALSIWAPLFGQGPGPVALTQFRAGAHGAALGEDAASNRRHEEAFIAEAERLWPGIAAARGDAPARVVAWPRDRFAMGSYACYRPGQWTGFGGIEGEREGWVFFAGEHTHGAYQGFMEGAARSGERVADEVLAAVAAGR